MLKSYCLKMDFDSAIDTFENYIEKRPGNPLGAFEVAFAHFSMVLIEDEISDEERNYHRDQSLTIFEKGRYT